MRGLTLGAMCRGGRAGDCVSNRSKVACRGESVSSPTELDISALLGRLAEVAGALAMLLAELASRVRRPIVPLRSLDLLLFLCKPLPPWVD